MISITAAMRIGPSPCSPQARAASSSKVGRSRFPPLALKCRLIAVTTSWQQTVSKAITLSTRFRSDATSEKSANLDIGACFN